jgi:superfamily II DNA or RNA helicase
MRCQSAEWRLGFSAAPRRADGHDMLLEAAFGPFIHHTDISSLIENNLAVPGEILFIQPSSYPPCERDRQPEEIFERAILANEARHDLVAAQARALAKQSRRVVVLAHSFEHARTLQARLPNSVLLEGRGDEQERRRAAATLESPTGSALVIAPVEGEYLLDFPSVDGVVLAAPGASETKALERVCRSLAPTEGKKGTRIVDFFDPVPYLKEKSAKRLEILQSQPSLKVVTEGF